MALKIGLIFGALPTYFPQKYNVFDRVVQTVFRLCGDLGVDVVQGNTIPMNGQQTRDILNQFRAQGVDFIMLVHGGFTMGDVAREIALCDLPGGVWATVEPTLEGDVQLNNFVSLNMTLSIMRKHRDCTAYPVQWFYGEPEDTNIQQDLCQHLQALQVKQRLQGAKIGLIGGVAPTFYNMHVAQDALKNNLGVDIEEIDMHHLFDTMAQVGTAHITTERALMAQAVNLHALTDSQIDKTIRCAIALRHIAQQGKYDALAVSDWPALQEQPHAMHPGAAFSWLEETDRLPIASEGDILGAVSQLIVRELTDTVGCILDMTLPQFDKNRILMWHGGGGALCYAKGDVNFVPHPMIGRGTPAENTFGAIADYEFAPNTYTLLRVSQNGKTLWAVETQVTPAKTGETGYTGCRGWMTNFTTANGPHHARDIVASIMDYGIEHHFILAPQSLLPILQRVAYWCGMTSYIINKSQ